MIHSAFLLRLEHAIGVYHLARLAVEQAGSLSLAAHEVEGKSLLASALLHGIGHFPYAYASERALAMVMPKTPAVANEVRACVEKVTPFLCGKCQKAAGSRGFVEGIPHTQLNRWFAANKVLNHQSVISRASEANAGKIARYLVCTHSLGYKLLATLDKMDYVLRDLFHTGEFKVNMDLGSIIEKLRFTPSGFLDVPNQYFLVDMLYEYLLSEIYSMPRVLAVRHFACLVFTNALAQGKLNARRLCSATDSNVRDRRFFKGEGYPTYIGGERGHFTGVLSMARNGGCKILSVN